MTEVSAEEMLQAVEENIRQGMNAQMANAPRGQYPLPSSYAKAAANPPPDYPFVALAQQTAEALIEATQRVVTDAANLLERNKAYAEQYLGDINKRAEELREVEDRQRAFGEATLNAHEKYSANGSKQ